MVTHLKIATMVIIKACISIFTFHSVDFPGIFTNEPNFVIAKDLIFLILGKLV